MTHNEIDLFDGHCDAVLQRYLYGGSLRKNKGHVDLERGGRYRRYAQFFALQEPMPSVAPPGNANPAQVYDAEYKLFLRDIERNQDIVSFSRTMAEAETAFAENKVAAFLSIEGADLLGCTLEGLHQAYKKGVRAVNLTWRRANVLSGAHADESERGLSQLGRNFICEMERLGLLVDVSHLSERGFWDVAETLSGPFIASHSNAQSCCFHRRNLTDEQFIAVIEHDGVAGLNLYANFIGKNAGLDTAIGHLEHWLSLGGEKHISLGADFDGCAPLIKEIHGLEDMDRLFNRLLQRNYPETLIRSLFFDNLMRVVKKVCTAYESDSSL